MDINTFLFLSDTNTNIKNYFPSIHVCTAQIILPEKHLQKMSFPHLLSRTWWFILTETLKTQLAQKPDHKHAPAHPPPRNNNNNNDNNKDNKCSVQPTFRGDRVSCVCYCVSYLVVGLPGCACLGFTFVSVVYEFPLCARMSLLLLCFQLLDSHVTVWHLLTPPSLFCLPVSAFHLDPKSLYSVVPSDIMSEGWQFIAQLTRFTELLKKKLLFHFEHTNKLLFIIILGQKWKVKTIVWLQRRQLGNDCHRSSAGREQVIEVLDQ